MTIPRAVQVQASSELSYRDAILRAICQASEAVRKDPQLLQPAASEEGDYAVGLKITLLLRDRA